jgi:hypothetical protein
MPLRRPLRALLQRGGALRADGPQAALGRRRRGSVALLHDAAEAYTVDVPRPLKRSLVGYKEAEAKVMAAIASGSAWRLKCRPLVHDADNRIIGDELANLVPMPGTIGMLASWRRAALLVAGEGGRGVHGDV